MLGDAAIESGQTDLYESSDFAFLFSICDDVSYYKQSAKRSGQMLASIYSAVETLLVTEGARRRVRVELQDDVVEEAEVVGMAERRRRIGMVGWRYRLITPVEVPRVRQEQAYAAAESSRFLDRCDRRPIQVSRAG